MDNDKGVPHVIYDHAERQKGLRPPDFWPYVATRAPGAGRLMRKETVVTITTEGRDLGKKFHIKEMPASRLESWVMRAMGAMQRAGMDIEVNVLAAGLAGFVAVGLKAFLRAPYEEIRPLLEEMFACIERVQDEITEGYHRTLAENDIEEFTTRVKLRDEVFELHMGFSVAVVLLAAASAQLQTAPSTEPLTTQTSDTPLEPSLQLDSPA